MVEKEASEDGIVDIVRIEPIVVAIAIHLEPDLVIHLQVEEDRAGGLVHVLVLVLVIGEEHSLVLLEEADLHVLHIDGDVVGEVVQPRDVAAEFARGAVIVVLLIVEDFSKANGHVGDGDPALQAHAEC